MSVFTNIIPVSKSGKIHYSNELGLDDLLTAFHDFIPGKKTHGCKRSVDTIAQTLDAWILGFETDLATIQERHTVINTFLDNPRLMDVVDKLPFPEEYSKDEYSTNAPKERVNTCYTGMTLLADAMKGNSSAVLASLNTDIARAISKVDNLRAQSKPEEVVVAHFSGHVRQLLDSDPESHSMEYQFMCRPLNGGRFTDYSVDEATNRTMNTELLRAIARLVDCKYNVHGSIVYDGEECTCNIQLGDQKHSMPLDGVSKFMDEQQDAAYRRILRQFDPELQGFMDLTLQLKAISTVAKCFKELEKRGCATCSADYRQNGSDCEMIIEDMVHPLLALDKKLDKVVANPVQIAKDRNRVLITGANYNGKSCYIDAIALNQILYQATGRVAAQRATMGIYDTILPYRVARGRAKDNDSDYSISLKRTLDLIDNISGRCLMICDEVGRGTDAEGGRALFKTTYDAFDLIGNATILYANHYVDVVQEYRNRNGVSLVAFPLDQSRTPPFTWKAVLDTIAGSYGHILAAHHGVTPEGLRERIMRRVVEGKITLRA